MQQDVREEYSWYAVDGIAVVALLLLFCPLLEDTFHNLYTPTHPRKQGIALHCYTRQFSSHALCLALLSVLLLLLWLSCTV